MHGAEKLGKFLGSLPFGTRQPRLQGLSWALNAVLPYDGRCEIRRVVP
jgi:hypothetical protein